MIWALNMSIETHEIDRLHIKAAVALPDGRIALMARGRNPKLFSEDVSGFILYFNVLEQGDGSFKLEPESQQRHFPAIFSRQLDHMHAVNDELVLT